PPALPFGQAAPDPEPLVVRERVLQALGPYLTATTHPFGFPGRTALLRKEGLRIGLRAQRPVLPRRLCGLIRANVKRVVHNRDDCVSHSAPPPLAKPRRLSGSPDASSTCQPENYTLEITPACLASRQGRYVIKPARLPVMTGKSSANPGVPASR